jgi:hypothetical protein
MALVLHVFTLLHVLTIVSYSTSTTSRSQAIALVIICERLLAMCVKWTWPVNAELNQEEAVGVAS